MNSIAALTFSNAAISGVVRLALIVGATITLIYMLLQISKSRMKIEHSIFWALFSGVLFLLALFPNFTVWLSAKIGIQSPINLLFLIIIFILIVKLFSTTLRLSHVDSQLTRLAQHIAIYEHELEAKENEKNDNNKSAPEK